MTALLLTALAFAGSGPAVFSGKLAPGGSSVQLAKVLAIHPDGSKLAWKIVASEDYDGMEAFNCGYAGMEKMPVSNVVLGVWDLKADTVTDAWTIYDSAIAAEQCTPHAESEKRLAEAKARFVALGLDISAPPAPLVVDGEGKLEWTSATGTHSLTVSNVPRRARYTEEEQAEDAMYSTTFSTGLQAKHGDTVLYTRLGEFSTMMAGGLTLSAPLAFPAGEGVVLLERWDHTSMRGGSSSFTFSPVLTAP